MKLSKKEQIKEGKTKEKLCKSNFHWSYRSFKLYWNKLEWVHLKTRNYNNNPSCSQVLH